MSTLYISQSATDVAVVVECQYGLCVGWGGLTTREALINVEADLVQALEAVRARMILPVTGESVAQAKDAARAERVAHGLDPDTGRPTPRNPGGGVAS